MVKAKTRTKTKKKIRWGRLFLMLIIIAMVVTAITQFLYYYLNYQYGVRQRQVYEMKLKVADYVGFSVDPDILNFGVVMPSGGSKRSVELSADEPTKVKVILKGDLAPWVMVSENNFVFEGDKSIEFTAVVPEDVEEGEYTGTAIILFKKP
ncbi:MAG: hypothetical protein IB618_00030 [Candidatus Pacearchaeota archaeon]|nr:MAG: hypothetical protein IB618_00030 [Candidatus Pacearchaeota archaeon]